MPYEWKPTPPADSEHAAWLSLGIQRGWLVYRCIWHDGLSITDSDELASFEDTGDTCIHRHIVIVPEDS